VAGQEDMITSKNDKKKLHNLKIVIQKEPVRICFAKIFLTNSVPFNNIQ
jgi:hypothetical protein